MGSVMSVQPHRKNRAGGHNSGHLSHKKPSIYVYRLSGHKIIFNEHPGPVRMLLNQPMTNAGQPLDTPCKPQKYLNDPYEP
jgi:hypothetical protein